MRPWDDSDRASVLAFLGRVRDGIRGPLAEEAASLLRLLDPPTSLPPATPDEDAPGGWLAAEERRLRRRALVGLLMRAPGHELPASEIVLPGITNRTALHRFLSRQVRCGFLRRVERPPRNPGGFPVGYYSLARPAPP